MGTGIGCSFLIRAYLKDDPDTSGLRELSALAPCQHRRHISEHTGPVLHDDVSPEFCGDRGADGAHDLAGDEVRLLPCVKHECQELEEQQPRQPSHTHWATGLGAVAGETLTENVDAVNGHEAVALLHDAAVVRLYRGGERERGKRADTLLHTRLLVGGMRALHIPRHLATCS